MWEYWMPDNDERGNFIKKISVNDKNSTIWQYNYEGGSCTAMGINHPSSFFSYSEWKPIVEEFLLSEQC
jgi:hypothetical protein